MRADSRARTRSFERLLARLGRLRLPAYLEDAQLALAKTIRMKTDIPIEPLELNYTNRGFLPHIGLHEKQGVFYQESSYSAFWFMGVMFVIAIIVAVLPWETEGAFGKLKYWVSGGSIWGGLCGLAPYLMRNILGQTVVADPQKKIVFIKQQKSNQQFQWDNIIALQVCYQPAPDPRVGSGYQLNIVWKDELGKVHRHCLLKHAIKKLVVSLGEKYSFLFKVELVDQSKK